MGKAKAGDGQVVLISGEPGIGKSRIVQELQDRIAGEYYYRLRHQCSPYHTNSALHPVIEQLGRAAGLELEDGTEARLDKLEALLALSGQPVEHAAPLIASLLSLSTGGRYTPLNFTPQRQKELTLQALVDQISGLAERQPLLLVFEDAHWIDPTTLELLELAVEHVLDIPVLMLVTYRPEFGAPWIGQSHVTQVGLNRLGYASWFMAENEVAENGFRKAVDLYDPVLHAKRADAYYGGYDLGVMAYCYLALCQFSLGYPDQAKVTFERAVDHARKLKRINRPPTARVLRVTSLTRLEYANAATHCMRSTR